MLTLLDFYADWCGPCKAMEPMFEEIKKDYSDKVNFKKIDVDTNNDIAMKYNVMSIPTFIILKNNEEIDRKTGSMPKETLTSWLKSKM